MDYPEFCFRQVAFAYRYNNFGCTKEVGLWLSRAIRNAFVDVDALSDVGISMVAIFGMPDAISTAAAKSTLPLILRNSPTLSDQHLTWQRQEDSDFHRWLRFQIQVDDLPFAETDDLLYLDLVLRWIIAEFSKPVHLFLTRLLALSDGVLDNRQLGGLIGQAFCEWDGDDQPTWRAALLRSLMQFALNVARPPDSSIEAFLKNLEISAPDEATCLRRIHERLRFPERVAVLAMLYLGVNALELSQAFFIIGQRWRPIDVDRLLANAWKKVLQQ